MEADGNWKRGRPEIEINVFGLSHQAGSMADRETNGRGGIRYVGPLRGVRNDDNSRGRERLRPDLETDLGGQEREEEEGW